MSRPLGNANAEMDAARLRVLLAQAMSNSRSGLYHPVTPQLLYDDTVSRWAGTLLRATGTYYFTPNTSYNTWPTGAVAVKLLIFGTWAAASNSSYMSVMQRGSSAAEIQVRALVANYIMVTQGDVSCDSDGEFQITIGGVQSTACLCRLLGYYL